MNTFKKINVCGVIVLGLFARSLFAQAGNDNPTGAASAFNGEVTTGCSYNAYTGNAHRSVTDMVIAGSVGAYPLAFTRVANSRYNASLPVDFGGAGNWLHSYQWTIDSQYRTKNQGPPKSFTVNYPDGRRAVFSPSSNGDPYLRGVPGVMERLNVIWDSSTAGRCYLLLPDGGQVKFNITVTLYGDYNYNFAVERIIDPYGLATTIATQSDGNTLITEPAGRSIRVVFKQDPNATYNKIIDHVDASDGRSVQYNYSSYATSAPTPAPTPTPKPGPTPSPTPTPTGTVYTVLSSVNYYGDSNLTATYTYQNDNLNASNGTPLLNTCDDPMYPGPMHKIAYTLATKANSNGTAIVSGQIASEDYYDGTNIGVAVSTLTMPTATTRTETRGDGKTRTFTYTSTPLLTTYTDFKGATASLGYGMGGGYGGNGEGVPTKYTDYRGNLTSVGRDQFTLVATKTTYPQTPEDTPSNTPAEVVSYVYGTSGCPDSNNRGQPIGGTFSQANDQNAYYLYSVTDEAGNTTKYLRDGNKRVTEIDYSDGGKETFQYNSFGQVTDRGLTTGGHEQFIYDSRGLLQKYCDAYHTPTTPSAYYQYNSLDRLSSVTDAFGSGPGDVNHTTNYTYNLRGQRLVTTLPSDPNDGHRYTITNGYNLADGTLTSVTDERLQHVANDYSNNTITSCTYDNYRRLRSVTTPGHNTSLTAIACYDDGQQCMDAYTRTDGNPTKLSSPGSETTLTLYDENRRKISLTVAAGTADAATTSYGYDANGNVTSMVSPNEQPGQQFAGKSTVTSYDERNRPYQVQDALGNTTTTQYDNGGRVKMVTRANGQTTIFDTFDPMNRLLQQTVKQTPDPDAVTKYTYYQSGLLNTMQDPHLVATNSPDSYIYIYDLMGRKTQVTYPTDSLGNKTTEKWHYDAFGRNDTFTNRTGNIESFTYDNLYRLTDISWNDGLTPAVHNGYDAANRLTAINNANANISRTYYNDGLLNIETTTCADNTPRTVTYTYDNDSNRAAIQYPNGAYEFTYNYTKRNQLQSLIDNTNSAAIASYIYYPDGNLQSRTLNDNNQASSYGYDALDRVTHISHVFNGTTRALDYGYDSVSNRTWAKRDGANGDVFGYDKSDQSISALLNVANPDTTSPGSQTIGYDWNGNRTSFSAYGPAYSYSTNALNQYSSRTRTSDNVTFNAAYNSNGDMTTGLDGSSTYTYDAQNRLLSATKAGSESFKYDGLNRQVSRTIGTAQPVYNVYDGWNLIGEYTPGATAPTSAYVYGAGGLVKLITPSSSYYYYQDGSGSTSHLADSTGLLVEWYRYDLQGIPVVYDASNNIRPGGSNYGVRHLFTGQQWYSDVALYDLRNRFYSPDFGRFLQSDPIRFDGGDINLYRYCGNSTTVYTDPAGLFRVGQFATGVASLGGGVVGIFGGAALSGTGVGAIGGVPIMLSGVVAFGYGIGNIVASFSDVPGAGEFQGTPSNLGGLAGLVAAGPKGQEVGTILEDLVSLGKAIRTRETADLIVSNLNLAVDLVNELASSSVSASSTSSEIGSYGYWVNYDGTGGSFINGNMIITAAYIPPTLYGLNVTAPDGTKLFQRNDTYTLPSGWSMSSSYFSPGGIATIGGSPVQIASGIEGWPSPPCEGMMLAKYL
jgi:RHS repeat-associated protein